MTTSAPFSRCIHLLYVPTLSCNLGCRYCYLGDQTSAPSLQQDARRAVATLRQALDAFLNAGVLPFNVSLHGGEPTMLPEPVLAELFSIIRQHYSDHYDELTARGFRKSSPHIKTNLFNFHKRYELFERNRVSISASIDLPLSLHATFRTTRQGKPWLKQTLDNLRLLASYPHSKKLSATLYREHLQAVPELIADIWKIHRDIGFDMNSFNFMFGFESLLNRERLAARPEAALHHAADELQLGFYESMQAEFMGTELEEGLRRNWFDEFKPSYCTNAFNCGERFLLLQGDGAIYSCVRGQGLEECCYGNILHDPVEEILANGRRKIAMLHQKSGLADSCRVCDHLHLCHTGCPVVKHQHRIASSYSCALQKALYRDNPHTYPAAANQQEQQRNAHEYTLAMHPALLCVETGSLPAIPGPQLVMPQDLYEEKNSLTELIAADPLLQQLYSSSAFTLELNGAEQPLASQIMSPTRSLYSINADDRIVLHLPRSLFAANCAEPLRNTLYIQMLRDTAVIYGDEKRTKQEHLFTYQIYYRLLESSDRHGEQFVMADLGGLLQLHKGLFLKGVLNNLFVTTSYLRDYHYQKQKANAFYHIQAINLPFQNFEFYWDA